MYGGPLLLAAGWAHPGAARRFGASPPYGADLSPQHRRLGIDATKLVGRGQPFAKSVVGGRTLPAPPRVTSFLASIDRPMWPGSRHSGQPSFGPRATPCDP